MAGYRYFVVLAYAATMLAGSVTLLTGCTQTSSAERQAIRQETRTETRTEDRMERRRDAVKDARDD